MTGGRKRESLGGRRWVKRSELIEKREAALEAKRRKVEPPSSSSSSSGPSPPSAEEDHHEKEELAALVSAPSEEVVRRLRAIGEPARLFGESDVARCERLAAAERAGRVEDEFKLEGAYAIRNTFLAEGDESEDESESEDETPPSNLKLIRSWIRARLGDWRRDLNARSDSEKRAPRGRVETKTFQQCRDYIRPLRWPRH
ncbi:hypothetical protein CTAYLR_010745 [Chrysophaeum taylorii]|uniref:Pre-mRNA processing factor 4 (PRP4)-like domain-containing protein n=1 Tax=Chrysophaeum taylorii TaxID=2483200 RepID=A0AAD7XHL8_9STRA|nr:hypothetical protein CTAYLR_010745 [Chrysophaeum taylorii]